MIPPTGYDQSDQTRALDLLPLDRGPGEQIYHARLIQDRAWMFMFKKEKLKTKQVFMSKLDVSVFISVTGNNN